MLKLATLLLLINVFPGIILLNAQSTSDLGKTTQDKQTQMLSESNTENQISITSNEVLSSIPPTTYHANISCLNETGFSILQEGNETLYCVCLSVGYVVL